jgi:hypothetical protein
MLSHGYNTQHHSGMFAGNVRGELPPQEEEVIPGVLMCHKGRMHSNPICDIAHIAYPWAADLTFR